MESRCLVLRYGYWFRKHRMITFLVIFSSNINNIGCVNGETQQQQNYPPSTRSEMEAMLTKLISSNDSEPLQEFEGKPVKDEAGDTVSQPPLQHNGYSFGSPPQINLLHFPH
ncbi:hypothetical protein VNO80_26159 [Phaseolus coccineus]|uniref:Uncharacterized protein n=1 Tax=Phaseolus coccineus TaxID=3886 RepID=A0AAN9LVH8_PHACN